MDNFKSKVVAVIPVYNEESFIENTINNIRQIDLIDEIIVVDDGSTDRTKEIVSKLDVTFIGLDKNRGKGYAINKAIEYSDFDYLVLIDGDLGKTSDEAIKLILPAINKEADVIIARFQKAKKKGGFGLVKKLANNGVYYYTGEKITSTLSGQRVYNRKAINSIDYIPDRFGVEVAMTVEVLRKGFTIKEVDVEMTHRETERNIEGFIHRGKQFLNILFTLIILAFRR
ncbi:glycosyltransferase family 2 protein [Proteiniborus sp. MB09-C3]|uniref:glycosyltransferase family 2 protein n=1 Tax=Proteiniborus sp. MB09-C3 TaxID=3050072 RepID=UPI002557C3AC|nr:glycosyltransferase family 2 protein [Proteiniborus sp. MB09-C3]WIV10982.1 glycosyltransferase family 2 protein [Proteiniborus sp. MB09-C3]